MVAASHLLAFALTALGLTVIPGPSVLFVIGRSLSLGRAGGLISVIGNELGVLAIAIAVALGVGVVVQQSAIVFWVVKVAGGLYLIYLGIQAIRHRNDRATAPTRPSRSGALWMLAQGFLVGVSNPKTIVFMIAVLPQFVDYGAGGIPLQLAILGATFVAIALITDSGWALAAGTARAWFGRSPRRVARLAAAGGVMMIGLGATVLVVGGDARR